MTWTHQVKIQTRYIKFDHAISSLHRLSLNHNHLFWKATSFFETANPKLGNKKMLQVLLSNPGCVLHIFWAVLPPSPTNCKKVRKPQLQWINPNCHECYLCVNMYTISKIKTENGKRQRGQSTTMGCAINFGSCAPAIHSSAWITKPPQTHASQLRWKKGMWWRMR